MPYELTFKKQVPIRERERYLNDCCEGGDVVLDRLLPAVKARYADVDMVQEDWGWFLWFRKGPVKLAIDVFTDDSKTGEFRIHLTSRLKRWMFFDSVTDTPDLDELRDLVQRELTAWLGCEPQVRRLDRNR